jgi:hypothetical protein
VAGEAARGQLHPHHRLLGGLDQVEAAFTAVAARHGQREPTDLADRLGDALEQVGAVVDQPLGPVFPAGLLVGDEREDKIPRRHDPRAFEVPGDRDQHAAHVLHVDRAAAPHIAVGDRTGERVHAPVRRLGGHHVEVPVQQQGPAVRIAALEPGEQIAPARRSGLDVFGRVTDLFQLFTHPAGAFGLALGGCGFAGVGRVKADERADEVNHLGFGVVETSHSHHSYH